MNYWLVKSEPDAYSIDDLARDERSDWHGVRNYQARNLMRDEMAVGDLVLYYHSSTNPPGVAGVAKVVKAGYPDATARDEKSEYYDPKASDDDPRWYMVDIAFVRKFPRYVTLDEIKETKGLDEMVLVKRSRLSVQPVTKKQFEIIEKLGTKK